MKMQKALLTILDMYKCYTDNPRLIWVYITGIQLLDLSNIVKWYGLVFLNLNYKLENEY